MAGLKQRIIQPYCTILVEQSYGDYIHTGSNKAYKAALTARNYLLSFMPSRYNEASVLNQDLRSKFK